MRKFLLYIIMMLYVNSYMFFPAVEETVQYDNRGHLVDAITSIMEYVDQVVLGHTDTTPDSKHQSEHFHLAKHRAQVHNQFTIVSGSLVFEADAPARQFSLQPDQKITHRSYDVAAPPPKA